jgi:hypothetical protein
VDFSIKSGRLIMIDVSMEKDDDLIPHHLLQNDTKQNITIAIVPYLRSADKSYLGTTEIQSS